MTLGLSRKNVWAALPTGLRRAAGAMLGILPAEALLGSRYRRELAFLQDAQWWPAERSRRYQLEQLRRLCSHAYRTRYYRRAFDRLGFHPEDLRSLDDLQRLPVIDRTTLRDHLAEMRASRWRSPRVDYVSTGGTSGVPVSFYIGAERSPIEYAYLTSGFARVGFSIGMPLAVLRGREVPRNSNGLHHEYDAILRHHYYSAFDLNDPEIGAYLEHIRGIGPCYLHAYPSTATVLVKYLRRTGIAPPSNVRGVLLESEILYSAQRRLIEQTFRCQVFSSYGMTEKVAAAAECERSSDYHVWPTYGILELIDGDGRPVTTPGERGEIVGTGFMNHVTPFIRYRTGDYATYVASRCSACGREHPIIRDIRGHRLQEHLVARDGSLIPWAAVNMHDDTFDHVRQFQFCQSTSGQAVLRIVAAPTFSSRDVARILKRLQRKLGGRLTVRVEMVDRIAASGRGKAIYVEQLIPGAADVSGETAFEEPDGAIGAGQANA